MTDRNQLLERLKKLLPPQFEEVLFDFNAPEEYLPATEAAVTSKAIKLIKYAEQTDDGLQRLEHSLNRVLGLPVVAAPLPRESMQVHFIHPYLLPDNFTGREAERQQLQAFLAGEQDKTVLAICALGGMGKSCLARQAVADLPADAPYQQVVWFSFYEARTEDEAYAFREILTLLNPQVAASNQIGAAQAKDWRVRLGQYLAEHSVLLILDGLEVIQHTEDTNSPEYGQMIADYQQTRYLLQQVCNQQGSRLLISSRVPLTDLEGAAGFVSLNLLVFSTSEAADYLSSFAIQGCANELQHCAELLGGHPLCLRAAGIQMQRLHIAANDIEQLVGDVELFRRSNEGERVAKIIDSHRADLTPAQEHFLKMLSIHPRSVSQRHFPALVQDYVKPSSDELLLREAQRDEQWVLNHIIYPLEVRGLLERLATETEQQYTTHPLIKLAFAAWLNPVDKTQAHQYWAKAVLTSPMLQSSPYNANSLEELQPWLDVIEHYLAAGEWSAAWEIYRDKGVDSRLKNLFYIHHLWNLGLYFEQALEQNWNLPARDKCFLYEYLDIASHYLEDFETALSYRERAFAAAWQSRNINSIVAQWAILADTHTNLGNIEQAFMRLKRINIISKFADGHSRRLYKSSQAKIILFTGNYQQAILLFEAALKNESYIVNYINRTVNLAEAQLRENLFQAAANNLQIALNKAEQHHVTSTIPVILTRYIWLNLAQNQTEQARQYNDRHIALYKSLDLPEPADDGFLLIAEGKFEQAIKEAQSALESIRAEGLDKDSEINNLLIISQAQQGLDDIPTARDYQAQAIALMEQTGCWREKNRLREI